VKAALETGKAETQTGHTIVVHEKRAEEIPNTRQVRPDRDKESLDHNRELG
jgi:hypothetical protein